MRVDQLHFAPRFDPAVAPGPLGAAASRLHTFGLLLRHFWPVGGAQKRLVDLGAGHGLFATMARTHGFRVTALDARARWTPAQAVGQPDAPSAPVDESIDWQRGDLRTFDLAAFEVVLAIGVNYHLPLQDQLDLFRRSAGMPTVVDTEVYDATETTADAVERLRPVVVNGFDGALCRETGNLWSAADTEDSFWPSHQAMLAIADSTGRRTLTVVDPPYRSRFGWRRWYVLDAPE